MAKYSGRKDTNSDLLPDGLSERMKCDEDPKTYGMDNLSDKKNQKPMRTPKVGVQEKGKSFTIC